MSGYPIFIVLAAGIAGLVLGAAVGAFLISTLRGQSLSKSKAEAQQLLDRARSEAQTLGDRAKVDAERAALDRKSAFESELEKSRNEMREAEKRIAKREDMIDKKLETLTSKEDQVTKQSEALKAKSETLDKKSAELDQTIQAQKDKLYQISGWSPDQAKQELLTKVEEETRHESAKIVAKLVEEAQSEAKTK